MITVTLRIRYGTQPVRPTRAWFVPGGDPGEWLEEIARWPVPHASVRLFPVPASWADRRPRGVLALVPDAAAVNASRRCMPYGQVADRLFLPVEAVLEPEVTEAELWGLLGGETGQTTMPDSGPAGRSLTVAAPAVAETGQTTTPDSGPAGRSLTVAAPGAAETVFVWHPAAELVGFAPGEVVGVERLIVLGPDSARPWDAARPGVACPGRLTAILPAQPPRVEAVLEEGREEIGRDAGAIEGLPRSPEEPRPGVAGAVGRAGRRAAAAAARWLARHRPGRGQGESASRLERWANKTLAAVRQAMEAARQKAVLRLLHLLETDPDRGLRYAAPLVGHGHRGVAPPTDRLVPHDVDFNLDDLRGGEPAECWCVAREHYARLAAKYRELANREIRLGRYRRAAYILAQLLGDLAGAASVLCRGRHWREAAVVYRDRLNRPAEAARCLEEGGLWSEAIALYEELGDFERAGQLWLTLDQPDRAREAFQRAADAYRSRGDLLAAARLLDQRLDDPDQALNVLESGWPGSPQAGGCLRELFRLLGRLGRHEEARRRIVQLGMGPPGETFAVQRADVLADLATGYPDRIVRQAAAETTRIVVARQLPRSGPGAADQLVAALARLAPEDRLLRRDCDRYLKRLAAKSRPAGPGRSASGKQVRLVRKFKLFEGITWKAVIGSGRTLYAAGFLAGRLILQRANWEGTVDPLFHFWDSPARLAEPSVILTASPLHDHRVLVHPVGSTTVAVDKVFAPSSTFPDEVRTGGLAQMPAGAVAACRTAPGTTWLLAPSSTGSLQLTALGPDEAVLASYAVPRPRRSHGKDPAVGPGSLHARSGTAYVGVGDVLLAFGPSGPQEHVSFFRPIRALAGSWPNTRPRIAVTFDEGGTVYWPRAAGGLQYWGDARGGHTEGFASDLPKPVAGFNRGGYLVAASSGGCQVYATQNQRLELEAEWPGPGAGPLAVLAAPRTDQFAIATATGEIAVYQLA